MARFKVNRTRAIGGGPRRNSAENEQVGVPLGGTKLTVNFKKKVNNQHIERIRRRSSSGTGSKN